MIKVNDLWKVYQGGGKKIEALRGIDLTVQKGEIFGIIGFSGAGKSSLIRCLNLLEKPTQGSIVIDGLEMTKLSPKELRKARTKIGMIFQHFNLFNHRNVFANVAFPLEIVGMKKEQIKKRVEELLKLVGLEDKAQNYPAKLSGGQKQRVGIARALANNPQVLLCDEATSALDPQTTKAILCLLGDINKKLGLTIVLITHEMQVVKEICHKVAVLEEGKIIEEGSVVDIFTRPKTVTTQNFVNISSIQSLPEKRIFRVVFIGETAKQPVISQIVRRFGLDVNILCGNIEHLQDQPFGNLIVEMIGEDESINGAVEYLQSLGIEVMNYVR